MARKKAVAVKTRAPRKTKNDKFENGLGNALGFPGGTGVGGGTIPYGFPGNQGVPGTQQVENVNTMFVNLRYYFISNFRQVLSQAYSEIGLIKTICDVPVDDALRGGVEIKSQELDEEEIAKLKSSLDRDYDLGIAGQAMKWNRLFGGAGILILTDQDPMEPLDIDAIGPDEKLEFRACDMWELTWDMQNAEGYDPTTQEEDWEFYSYYGEKVHKSRVMRLKGEEAPSFVRPRLRGWGLSVVEQLVRSINQYLKGTALGFEVLDEFKLDVYKIKNLTNSLLSAQGSEAVQRRIQIANYYKNYQSALIMDAEDDYDHKQLSFAGLAEAMSGIRIQVAADMRIPITKLFGISATGFNSGEDDIEVYNSMVESSIRQKIKYDILRILELKCKKLFGYVPSDLEIDFAPLRVLSSVEEETVKTQKFQRVSTAMTSGWITEEEFRNVCNKGGLFDITLDTDVALLGDYDADDAEAGPNDEGGADDGANRGSPDSPRAKPDKPKDPNKDPARVKNTKWDEGKHPRADDGKFGEGGDSGKKSVATVKAAKPSRAQSTALTDYKRQGFTLINTFLRNPDKAQVYSTHEYRDATDSEKKRAEKDIAQIDAYMAKNKTAVPLKVYRGVQSATLAKDPQALVGKTLTDDAYMSTTTNPKFATFHTGFEKSRVEFEIDVPEGTSAINMEQFSGDAFKGESEMLLPRGGSLTITGVKTEGGRIVFQATFSEGKIENAAALEEDAPPMTKDEPEAPTKPKPSHSVITVKPYTKTQSIARAVVNSAAFDRASYEADGGDEWIDERRAEFFTNPTNVDEGLWSKAKDAAQSAFGQAKWQFTAWWYKKQGGRFS